MLTADSTTCTTSSAIRPSCWWAGFACGTTRVRARPRWTARPPTTSRPCGAGRVPYRTADRVEGPQLPAPACAAASDPKAGGKVRYLGIATIRDPVVQESLKLVLEPIFEADFQPCSYGFRPRRRAHDAVAEVRHLTSHPYEWIGEGDIKSLLRRNLAFGLDGSSAGTHRGQPRPDPGERVSQGGHPR